MLGTGYWPNGPTTCFELIRKSMGSSLVYIPIWLMFPPVVAATTGLFLLLLQTIFAGENSPLVVHITVRPTPHCAKIPQILSNYLTSLPTLLTRYFRQFLFC